MASDPDNPGNVEIVTLDVTAQNMLHNRAFGNKAAGLLLFPLCKASRVALVIVREHLSTDGHLTVDDPVAYVPPLRYDPEFGPTVATAVAIDPGDGVTILQTKTRATWTWRWRPENWATVFFQFGVMEAVGHDDPVLRTASAISHQEPPALIDDAASDDPLTWPIIPGTGGGNTEFPADAGLGHPVEQYLRILHPIIPPHTADPAGDLASYILKPVESVNTFPENTLPLPLPDWLGYLAFNPTVNGYKFNLTGPL